MFSSWWFSVGKRFSLAKRSSRLVAFLARLSIGSLAFSVAILITVLSVMNGFEQEMRERILSLVPHMVVTPPPHDDQFSIAQLEQHPEVIRSAPLASLNGLAVNGEEAEGVIVLAVDPIEEAKISRLDQFVEGATLSALSDGHVLLGKQLSQRLQLNRGQRFNLLLENPATQERELMRFEVAGVVNSQTELDRNLILVDLSGLEQRLGSSLQRQWRLAVNDVFEAPRIAWELRQQHYGLPVRDWTRTHGNLYSSIQLSKRLVSLALVVIIAVAAFNVISSLLMAVNDKRGNIAIMRSMGAKPAHIWRIFLVQGSLVGFIGVVLGVLLGLVFSTLISPLVAGLERVLSIQFLKGDVYPITYLPSAIAWEDVIWVAVVSFVLTIVASLFPAWRASKLQPASVLRDE